ncbi:MAG: bifunctional UDP-sugar hydrolase/5'-nucleotidase [Vicinamibacterales bacterium]
MKRLAVVAILAAIIGPAKAGPHVRPLAPSILHAQQQEDDAAARRNRAPVTLLQLNDIYSTLPVNGLGGLARIATLKQQLTAAGSTPLLVLAGDFLSPSVASSIFKGEQMIAALNAAGLDLATLGNHEFDFGKDVLIQRMSEAKWQWVVSNVIDRTTGRPVGGAAPYVVRTIGGLKVGFIGLCLTTSEISRGNLTGLRLVDPVAAAAQYLPALRRQGANVIVAITHLKLADDRELARRFPQIDLIIGGHEHEPVTTTVNRTLISKAGSDGKWVARIDVGRRPNNRTVERFYELVSITSALADEPRTAEVIRSYEDRLSKDLEVVVGTTSVPLDSEDTRVRSSETNLGNFVADAVRADAGTDVAIVNAGGIRGDRLYPAGPLTRRTLVEIHTFGNLICTIALPGRVLLQALNHGVARLPAAAGQFPQVSGLTMTIDPRGPPGDRVRDVRVGGQPLDLGRTYSVAIPDYLLKGGDNYTVFAGQRVLVTPEAGRLMLDALEKYVSARGTIAPAIDGRITVAR